MVLRGFRALRNVSDIEQYISNLDGQGYCTKRGLPENSFQSYLIMRFVNFT
jgi:hypothetical protein